MTPKPSCMGGCCRFGPLVWIAQYLIVDCILQSSCPVKLNLFVLFYEEYFAAHPCFPRAQRSFCALTLRAGWADWGVCLALGLISTGW